MSNYEEIKIWVNKELKLSRKVAELEKDFKNGFLFKELMKKLGCNIPEEFHDK